MYRHDSTEDPVTDLRPLPLIQWRHMDHTLTDTAIFWDANENGVRDDGEAFAQGVVVNLYQDANKGVPIDTAATDVNGKFTLRTFLSDANQIIEIVMPKPMADTDPVVKLTRQSADDISHSGKDSDFDRKTNTLILPAIPTTGITNLSAGLVRLPKLAISNQSFRLGEPLTGYSIDSLTLYSVISPFPDSPVYRVVYGEPDDTKIVFFGETTDPDNQISACVIIPELRSAGTANAKVWIINTLGDVAEAEYEILVNEPWKVTYSYTNTPLGAPLPPAGEDVPFGTLKQVSSPEPMLKGYTFSGWTTKDVQVTDGKFYMPGSDVHFTGTWTAVSGIVVTFDANTTDPVTGPDPVSGLCDYQHSGQQRRHPQCVFHRL